MPITERSIEIKCPNPDCEATTTIKVPDYLFQKKQAGLLKIQIHQGVCCNHQFIIFLSTTGQVKGYEQIDLQIDISEIAERTIGQKIFLRDLLKLYGEFPMGSMLHSIVLNYPILLLRSTGDKNRANDINKLFNDYLPENYKNFGIVISIEEKEYQKAKIEDSLVITPQGLIAQTPWADIQFTFEQNLMRKAMDILDDDSQAVIIQQEIEFLFKKAKYISGVIKEKSQIYEDDLKTMIRKEFNDSEISDYDLILLKRIVQRRFKGDIAKIKIRSFDKLKQGLW